MRGPPPNGVYLVQGSSITADTGRTGQAFAESKRATREKTPASITTLSIEKVICNSMLPDAKQKIICHYPMAHPHNCQ